MRNETSADFDEKRGAILRAAVEIFSRFGFKKATLEEIAKRAGLAKPSIYHYFQSKEELASAVVSYESRALLSMMRSAIEGADSAEEKIKAFVRARYEYLQAKKNLLTVTQDVFHEVWPLVVEERDRYFEAELGLLTEIMKEGIEAGELEIEDQELFSVVAISALQGLDRTFWRYRRSEDIAEGIQLMLGVFLSGLRSS